MTTVVTTDYRLIDNDRISASEEAPAYVLRVRDLDSVDRPRERLSTLGPSELSTAELLAVIWGVGTKREDVLAMARRTLKDYGEKSIGSTRDPVQLAEAADIPLAKASQLVATFELGRRYYSQKGGRPLYVRNASQAHQYLQGFESSQKEQLRGLYLNSRYRVVHEEVISIGSLTASIVHPREVFLPALERGAVALILAHNHPSGSVEPTAADRSITEQLVEAGLLLGIELLDHIIIAPGGHYASIINEETTDED